MSKQKNRHSYSRSYPQTYKELASSPGPLPKKRTRVQILQWICALDREAELLVDREHERVERASSQAEVENFHGEEEVGIRDGEKDEAEEEEKERGARFDSTKCFSESIGGGRSYHYFP